MIFRKKTSQTYHHGDLAAALLDAVDALAGKFGLEAVSLRACAKSAGVSPAAAFRHYADKRALLTAFASRGLKNLADDLQAAQDRAHADGGNGYLAIGLAYVSFALDQPAKYQVIWRQELLNPIDEHYRRATAQLREHLSSGFIQNLIDDAPNQLNIRELLAWASLHGVASLMIDGPVGEGLNREERIQIARAMLIELSPNLTGH